MHTCNHSEHEWHHHIYFYLKSHYSVIFVIVQDHELEMMERRKRLEEEEENTTGWSAVDVDTRPVNIDVSDHTVTLGKGWDKWSWNSDKKCWAKSSDSLPVSFSVFIFSWWTVIVCLLTTEIPNSIFYFSMYVRELFADMRKEKFV